MLRCSASWAALFVLGALNCHADSSSCQGSCDASPRLAGFESDETSLLHLKSEVNRRGAKSEQPAEATPAANAGDETAHRIAEPTAGVGHQQEVLVHAIPQAQPPIKAKLNEIRDTLRGELAHMQAEDKRIRKEEQARFAEVQGSEAKLQKELSTLNFAEKRGQMYKKKMEDDEKEIKELKQQLELQRHQINTLSIDGEKLRTLEAAPKPAVVLLNEATNAGATLPARPTAQHDAFSLSSKASSLLSMLSRLSARLQGESASASATQSHMLAYVALFAIVIVLFGCALLIVVSIKNDRLEAESFEDEGNAYENQEFRQAPYKSPSYKSPGTATLLPGSGGIDVTRTTGPAAAVPATRPAAAAPATLKPPTNSPPRQPRKLPSPNLLSMQGNPITPSSGSRLASGTSDLCPELAGATVPDGSKFPMKVPLLLHKATEDEYALERSVLTKDGTPMFILKITHTAASQTPGSGCLPQEYLSLCLPDEEERELVMCAFGRPTGQLECHMYKLGKEPWGFIKGPEGPGDGSYTLILRSGKPALTAQVEGSNWNRKVRIVHSEDRNAEVAIANARTDSDTYYEVECYPLCDIILSIIMLTAVDRMSQNAHS